MTDTTGKSARASIVFDVGGLNALPGCTILTPADGYATGEGLAIGFTGTVVDADQSTYAWSVDGAPAGTGTTLTGSFVGGAVVTCALTPYDGTDDGAAVASNLVTAVDTAPSVTTVTISPTTPRPTPPSPPPAGVTAPPCGPSKSPASSPRSRPSTRDGSGRANRGGTRWRGGAGGGWPKAPLIERRALRT